MDGSQDDSDLERSTYLRPGTFRPRTVSLREWLDRPGREVDLPECLHIFQQVAEAVSLAHAEGVVVSNVRPSCFVMSTFNRVSFIESASCSSSAASGSSGSDRSLFSTVDDVSLGIFPLKQILLVEFEWYVSGEEDAGEPATFASDIYRLGVLLFELFSGFGSMNEKIKTMSNLRHRVLPPQLLLNMPNVASFCLRLLHPVPNARPNISEVLQSELLHKHRDNLEEREATIKLREEMDEHELLMEFLLKLRQQKQATSDKLHDTICFLSSDMEDVLSQQSILKRKGHDHSELENDEYSAADNHERSFIYPVISDESTYSVSENVLQPQLPNYGEGKHSEFLIHDDIMSKSSRLMKNFEKFESAYLSTRCRLMESTNTRTNKNFPVTSTGRGSNTGTERSSVDNLAIKESHNQGRKSEWIGPFLESLCKYLSFSKLKLKANLKQGDLLNSSNLVCSLGFDRDKEFFASAGVNRKIKVFECDAILNEDSDIHYSVAEMASRSRLSCICWNNYIKSQLASSDFEGVVQVWDVTRSQVLSEMREHESRVWSVDFSLSDPKTLASGSDDGTVKLWNINQAGSTGTIQTKANVCSVQFPPGSGRSLAIGSADHKIYCYDLRNLRMPFCTLVGHTKTVSYAKYVGPSDLVSASTDNSLKLWDLSTTSRVLNNPLQTFSGHTNVKNFVGLSVFDGYIATGSETNEVFVYHKAFPMPVLSYKFNSEDQKSGDEADDGRQFISCLCWRGRTSTLLVANSCGDIKILELI